MIIYYNVETKPGFGGGPVFLIRESKMILIGVHAGFENEQNMKLATGINKRFMDWIF